MAYGLITISFERKFKYTKHTISIVSKVNKQSLLHSNKKYAYVTTLVIIMIIISYYYDYH